jgi:hypothetical protein
VVPAVVVLLLLLHAPATRASMANEARSLLILSTS